VSAANLSLVGHHIHGRVGECGQPVVVLGAFFGSVQVFVCQFFYAFKAQKSTAYHQQRGDQNRGKGADGQCQWYQNGFVAQGAYRYRPDYRQLALGLYAGYLLGVQRQVIAQYASGFLGGNLGHYGDIVQDGGNVINQHQQATTSHDLFPVGKKSGASKAWHTCKTRRWPGGGVHGSKA